MTRYHSLPIHFKNTQHELVATIAWRHKEEPSQRNLTLLKSKPNETEWNGTNQATGTKGK